MAEGPTKSECMKMLTRGRDITLPDASHAVFLEFMKGSKATAWVLKGGLDGPKTAVSVSGIIKKTWGI